MALQQTTVIPNLIKNEASATRHSLKSAHVKRKNLIKHTLSALFAPDK
jgi:hypothetical protein